MDSLKSTIFVEVRNYGIGVDLTYEEMDSKCFYKPSGLRLTFTGYLALKNIFKVYSFEIDEELSSKHYIGLKSMVYPYYITSKRLILFSSEDASVIKLSGGVKNFLETSYKIAQS